MIRSYLRRWRLSESWDIYRKNILDTDKSRGTGSVTYAVRVGTKLAGTRSQRYGKWREVREDEEPVREIHLDHDMHF